MVALAGFELEVFDAGAGAPLLFLHSGQGFTASDAYVDLLAKERRLIAPSHPGFGRSDLPDWIDRPEDIAFLYLELLDRLALGRVDIVGSSLGGWIAAEMGAMAPERVRRLVLAAPVGVKTGPVDRLDIPDIYAMPQEQVNRLLFHDPEKFARDPATLPEDALRIFARNRETLALLVWEPYMHNPKLKHRLHRLRAPTLFLRGASDGLVGGDYLERYARLLPDARIATIPAAGHALATEQPEAFARAVLDFLGEGRA